MNCECDDFYMNKIKPIIEIKISDFNYKLFSNILATMQNLHRWKKIDTENCIYCNHESMNSRHLLFECPILENTWLIVSNVINCQIDWKTIVMGLNDMPAANSCISIICYIIYKKYLIDKDSNSDVRTPTQFYVKKELTYKLQLYREIEIFNQTNLIMRELIDGLS
mgnify:CR=1 FL=1